MTLIVGLDSYLSRADADGYFAARAVGAWAEATVAAREAALRRATAYLDARYRFVGRPADADQPLAWPRQGAVDADGRTVVGVPTRVVHACAELALAALSEDLAPAEPRGGRVRAERIGPLEIRYEEGAPTGRGFPFVDLLLRGLLVGGGAARRLTRT